MEALAGIGFIGLIVGIIWLIVSAIRKARKSIPLAILGVGLVMLIIGAAGSSSSDTVQNDNIPTQNGEEATPQDGDIPTQNTEETILIGTDASELVLKIDDFEPGWVLSGERSAVDEYEGAQSAYFIKYINRDFTGSLVQSTVIVYPTVETAKSKFEENKPENISLEKPNIGDDAFCDVSIPSVESLWFRERNVLVSIWTYQTYLDDAESYAEIIEGRIELYQ